jgi:hypothetical protein
MGPEYWFPSSHDLVTGVYPEPGHQFEGLYVRQNFATKMHNTPHDIQRRMQQNHLRTVRLNRQLKQKRHESNMAETPMLHDCKPCVLHVAPYGMFHIVQFLCTPYLTFRNMLLFSAQGLFAPLPVLNLNDYH